MKPWTQMHSVLPAEHVILKFALRAVRKAAYGTFPADPELPIIAGDIAAWIARNFDPAKKKRGPRKSSRADRSNRDKEIARVHSSAISRGEPVNYRQLAKQFGVSASTITRALAMFGQKNSDEISDNKDILELASYKRVLEKLLPRDGRRAVDAGTLGDQLGIEQTSVWPRLNEFAANVRGWYFYSQGHEIIISRGRQMSKDEVAEWRDRARAGSILSPKRQLQDHGRAVWADLLTIVSVCSRNASGDDWRAFLRVVTTRPIDWARVRKRYSEDATRPLNTYAPKLVADDPDVLANRIARALREQHGGDQIRSIEYFNQGFQKDSAVLSDLLYAVEVTWDYELGEAVQAWLEISCYTHRVEMGLLPGRDLADVDSFLEALREYDAEVAGLDVLLAERAVSNR